MTICFLFLKKENIKKETPLKSSSKSTTSPKAKDTSYDPLPTPDKKKVKDKELPKFLINIRDANMNTPDSPHYDPTTIYIPKSEYESLTDTRKQYWDVKRNNFDKIVCIQIGSFYELFYGDAEIGNKLLGLKIHTAHSGKN